MRRTSIYPEGPLLAFTCNVIVAIFDLNSLHLTIVSWCVGQGARMGATCALQTGRADLATLS